MDADAELVGAERLVRDLMGTLGWDRPQAEVLVATHLTPRREDDDADLWLFHLTQRIQDLYRDDHFEPTWPLCPRHECHALLVEATEKPLSWRCPVGGQRIAPLGELAGPR